MIYNDITSGVRSNRKDLNQLIKYMYKVLTVIAYKNDRVFRFLKNMVELVDKFNQAGVYFKSLSDPEFDIKSAKWKVSFTGFLSVGRV